MTTGQDYLDRVRQTMRVLGAHDCQEHGHDWTIGLVDSSPYPTHVYCSRDCGAPILNVEQPTE